MAFRKQSYFLLLLLSVSSARPSIGETLLSPLRSLYNGPMTTFTAFTGRVWRGTIELPEVYTTEVYEVLDEMGMDASKIRLRMLKHGEHRYINEHHELGMINLIDRVEAFGGMLIFDENFFDSIPKGQRRALIGHEAWHVNNFSDLKGLMGNVGLLLTFPAGGFASGYLSYILTNLYGYPRNKVDRPAFSAVVGFLVGVACVPVASWAYHAIERARSKAADTYTTQVLGCAHEAIDYLTAQLERNQATKKNFPECYQVRTENGREVSRRRISPDEVYDSEGNCLIGSRGLKITDRITYLHEFTKGQHHELS